MYDATTVANEIRRAIAAQGRTVTPLQLVKLVYVAHGFSLAILGHPLFSEAIQAWKYGPVVRSVYHKAKVYGRSAVASDLPPSFFGNQKPLDKNSKELIEKVAENWGHLSGIALSNWTHLPGSPWHQVYKDGVENLEIPNDIIRDYFANFIEQNKQKHERAVG